MVVTAGKGEGRTMPEFTVYGFLRVLFAYKYIHPVLMSLPGQRVIVAPGERVKRIR